MEIKTGRPKFVQTLKLGKKEYDISTIGQHYDEILAHFSASPPSTPDLGRLKQVVGMLWKSKLYDKALDALEKAQQKYSLDYDLEFMWGEILLDRGSPAKAVEILEPIRSKYPRIPEVYHVLGEALYKAGRPGDAEKVLLETLSLKTWNPSFLMVQFEAIEMLARIAYDREDYPRALQLLQDVITVHPKSGKWQLYLKLLQKMGMENELEEARQSYDAIKTARRYQNRASRYEAQGKPEAALNNYQKALELNPGEPHYYFSIGSVLESLPENEYEFQLQEATAYYKAAWELFPNNPFYAISYVGNLINTDQWENAFEVAKSAALKYPELMLPNLRFLVQVLAKEKEYEELLQEITDSDPQGELTEIRSEMAMILGEKGDPAAKEWFAKASSLYRDKIEMYPYNWHYYYDYGSCLAEQEDLPRARENLIKALELYGDFSVNVAEKLSSILYRMACYDEARLLLEALVMSNPRDYEYLGRMGMCFLAVADYQKGLEAFNRSLILNRNVPEYLYGAGVCAAHLNRAEDVINIIKDLLEMNDQFIEVIEQEPAFARMDGKEKFFQLVEGRKEKRTAALARQAGD